MYRIEKTIICMISKETINREKYFVYYSAFLKEKKIQLRCYLAHFIWQSNCLQQSSSFIACGDVGGT